MLLQLHTLATSKPMRLSRFHCSDNFSVLMVFKVLGSASANFRRAIENGRLLGLPD